MIGKIVEFLKEAGKFAADNQKKISPASFKEERVGSVVTETDLTVSRMFKAFVDKEFSHLNHVIIDEETLSDLGEDKFATVAASEYQFVLDPIDGTHTYALGTPNYAISVGVLKNSCPWLGAVCVPALAEMIYYDGENVHWLRGIYNNEPEDIIIKEQELSRLAVIFSNDWFVKINDGYESNKETILSFYSAVLHFFYMATNRARCYYCGVYIWDIAGSWPSLKAMGFDFYEYDSGKVLEKFSTTDFNEKFKLKKLYITCKKPEFARLKEISDLRKGVE